MKTLLTGGAGFIGTHVRERLFGEVSIVDVFEPRVHGDSPKRHVTYPVYCDALTKDDLREVDPDVIIHLAAQVGVADSMEDPHRYVGDNTVDTLRFLETLKYSGVRPKKLVVASSMSVYGDPLTKAPITEETPVRPASIYGLTKFDQEALTLMYGEMLGIPTVALRFFNVYGPGQALTNPYTGVLAIFASALLEGRAPTIYEDGLQTRDFVYVEDVAYAVVQAALGDFTGVYNVCTGTPTTVLRVAGALRDELAPDVEVEACGEVRAGDIRHCVGDPSKLASVIGWRPRPFAEGVKAYAKSLLASVQG